MFVSRTLRISLVALAALAGAPLLPATPFATVAAVAAPKVSGTAVEAVKLALKGQFVDAGAMAQKSGDMAAIKLVELLFLRDHPNDAGYQRIIDFLNAAPKWPMTESLMKRAERSLYVNGEPPQVVMGHFANRKPVTSEGRLALARALIAQGDMDGARAQVQKVWYNPELDPKLESQAVGEFGKFLTTDDYKVRMWRQIYAQETNAAIRTSKKINGDFQKAAAVAQKLLRGEGGAEKAYAALPKAMREQLGMKYALVRFLRKKEAYSKARAVLVTIPGDPGKMGDPEAWWTERRIVARHSVGINHRDAAKAGYQIAKAHGFTSGENAMEGEFLAGWIALRYLKKPDIALGHFGRLAEIADTRTEKARAGYWTGRALEASGRKGEAKASYKAAAQYSTVYYGQLAREKIGLGSVPEEIESGQASDAARARVDKDEVARAFTMMAEAGAKNDLYMFIWSFANRFKNTDEMNAAASLMWDVGGATMSVRLAKAAAARNVDIDSWGYPIRALPEWKQIGRAVEKPLVFALARQESEFNPKAGSRVGAQGLMQIMPGTAKMIARQYGLSYSAEKLMDPNYNVKLGAAHLGDLINNFGGSYVLTLVAYNAGPRRSREWVAEYGDLRTGEADPIDWVESIPFQETRQYVQKVMQNLHVYRSRLAPKTVRPMTADLSRGATGDGLAVATTSPVPASDESPTCANASIADMLSTSGCE